MQNIVASVGTVPNFIASISLNLLTLALSVPAESRRL